MTAFEHLVVLISIVLGLAMAHLLSAVHRVVLHRAQVRFYWLPLLWALLLFLTQVVWWWGIFALRGVEDWNFFYFLTVLLSPVALYLASASVLPEVEAGRPCDLRAYYYHNRGLFFAAVTAGPVLDAVRRWTVAGTWEDVGVMSNAISALLVASLTVGRRPAHHAAVTLVVAALFVHFIISQAVALQ